MACLSYVVFVFIIVDTISDVHVVVVVDIFDDGIVVVGCGVSGVVVAVRKIIVQCIYTWSVHAKISVVACFRKPGHAPMFN